MIERLWYGWTEPEDADEYERLLAEEIVPSFEAASDIAGFRVGRRELGDEGEVEFVTTIEFESWDAVESFAGEDYEEAHVPEPARGVLKRWENTAQHYEVTRIA